jgi:predicted nucleic acid-binding protein
MLRTLDALHLSTAAAIGSELDTFITYDKRLADAATGIGLTVAAPS